MSSLGVRHNGGEPAAAGRHDGFALIMDDAAALTSVDDESALTSLGIRELARNVSGVVAEVARSRRPAIVTKRGEPVAAVIPLESGEFDQAMLIRPSHPTGRPGPGRGASTTGPG